MCAMCMCAGIFGLFTLVTLHTRVTTHFALFHRKTDSTKYLFFIFFVVFGHKRQTKIISKKQSILQENVFIVFRFFAVCLYKVAFKIHFLQKSEGACAKCDHHKMKVHTTPIHSRSLERKKVQAFCL